MSDQTVPQLVAKANALTAAGQTQEAIIAYRDILSRQSDLPDCWFNLAFLLRQTGEFQDALAAYGEALRHGVSGPEEVHVNRAVILSDFLERPAEAAVELKAALAINPQFLTAWLNLGQLYEDAGDRTQASEAYREALAVFPHNGRAHARLAALDMAAGEPARAVTTLDQAMADPGAAEVDQLEMAFALANALDAAGEYQRAFAVIDEANRTVHAQLHPDYRYDRDQQDQMVDAIIAAFPEKQAVSTAASSSSAPLFICGMFRSGSTLIEHIASRHSGISAGGEMELLPMLLRRHTPDYPDGVTPEAINNIRAEWTSQLAAIHPGAALITDKRPDNFLYIGLIKAIFPDAKIVNTVRSPLDNILSVYFLHFTENVAYGFDLDDIIHRYRVYQRLMDHWKSLYPDDIIDVDYDALVANPRSQIEQLLSLVGLDWEEACLSPESADRHVRTASLWQVRQPLHSRSSGRWRNYAPQLEEVRRALSL